MKNQKKARKAQAAPPQKSRGRATATIGTLAIVAGYVFVSGAFTMPPTPAQAAVENVFAPYFSQRWDVFAPNILKTNSSLELQAQWRDADGELVHSDWVGATDMELGAVKGSSFSSRISKNTVNAVGTYITRYEELSEEQQERVEDTFIEVTDDGGFSPIADDELVSELTDLGDDNEADVIRFMRYDYMLGRYADAFAEAHFGEEVERVRWRIRFDRPNDFEERFESRVKPTSYITFGWRQPSGDPADDTAAVFDDVLGRYEP
ncbi:DUF5819 family protein [Microbacterium sp. P06]|uniref:DUF5819 family protein n=1 Tax=unclassified Microbacterium TaxID=2609290 RepID=UPI003745EABA